jgi:hypothetical protein
MGMRPVRRQSSATKLGSWQSARRRGQCAGGAELSAGSVPVAGGRRPVAPGAKDAPALADVSSSTSAADATGEATELVAGALALAAAGVVPLVAEPDAQPATRRTKTTSSASATLAAFTAVRILGSNPRQDLLLIGIGVPPPLSPRPDTATTRDRPILRGAWMSWARTHGARRLGTARQTKPSRSGLGANKSDGPWRSSRGHR